MQSIPNEIVWVQDSRDLYRFAPGGGLPELIYSAPRGSYIPEFTGSSSGYAIITQDSIEGFDPPTRWRLWYLADAGQDVILVDEYDNDHAPLPDLAMDERRIAWTPNHGAGDCVKSELRVAEIGQLNESRTLLSYAFWDTNINGPALNGDELWYGIRVNDWNAGTESPRVEMLDLANPATPPQIYGEAVRAFMPAANDQVVVWKGGGAPQDAADNWGSLYVYWRTDGTVERVANIGRAGKDRVMFPSLGDRFVAWWDGHYQLYLYDLIERTPLLIEDYDPYGGIQRASISGSLLSYPFGDGIRWALLPE